MKVKSMKLTILLFLLCIFTAQGLWAGPAGNGGLSELRQRLVTLRNWTLMEQFDLKGKRADRVFDILKRFDDERFDLLVKRRMVLKKIREELARPNPSQRRLERLLDRYFEINKDLSRIPYKENQALSEVFTIEERARYLLFSNRFAWQIRRALRP